MGYRQNVNKLYVIIFFHNLIPAYVIERLFWQDRGMTVMAVVLCEMIYAITIVICEVPTGILADKFGKKVLLVIGGFFSFLEMILLLFAHSFWMFAFAVGLAGVAGACVSGALHALLYDSLLHEKREKHFEKFLGRLNSLDFIAAILAALSGSVLAKWYGFELNYWLSAASMLIAFGFTFLLRDPPMSEMDSNNANEKRGFKVYLFDSLAFFTGHPKLVVMIFQAMAIAACITYLDEFWQLYLNEIGFAIVFFGLFSAFISLARIPGNLLASRLVSKYEVKVIIFSVLFICTIGFMLTWIFQGIIGIVIIVIMFLASGVAEPVMVGYLHHQASSLIRATIESIQSLLERVITFGIGIGFGVIATKATVIFGFAYLGIVLSGFLVWFVVRFKDLSSN